MPSKTGGDDPPANGHPLYMQTRGEIIRRARIQKRISQERLGELTGVTRSAVNQWEANRTEPEGPERLRLIAEALGIDPAILVNASAAPTARRTAEGSQSDRSQDSHSPASLIVWKSVPTRGSRFGGFVIIAEKDGEIPRPQFLEFSQKAFAFKVIDSSNSPVYNPRDRLLVNPEDPALPGDDCLFSDGIEREDGSACVVGNLIRSTPTLWIIRQYAARNEIELPKSEYPNAWPVVGRYHRR